MACHGVVDFLAGESRLNGVDSDFRELIRELHRIPHCASFGVSCAGHFYQDVKNWLLPNEFNVCPCGHLDIIVQSDISHIKELLDIFRKIIASTTDSSFKKIYHIFGPKESRQSRAQVWKIRIGDNGCMGDIKSWGKFSVDEYPELHAQSKARCEEIRTFWKALEEAATAFCQQHSFGQCNIRQRTKEIVDIW